MEHLQHKTVTALVLLGLGSTLVWAQKTDDFKLSAYGFIDVRSYADTRNSAAGADGYLYLYPLVENMSAGIDGNGQAQASMLGASARMGFNLTGPKVLDAASRVNVEFEMFNYSSSNHFLFRHAYIGLDWDNESITLGQTWHPMSKLLPAVGSISLGSPFNALNRSGQLRYDRYAAGGLTFTGAAIFQSLSNSYGPTGKSFEYQRRGMLPELFVGLQWDGEHLGAAVGGSYQKLSPAVGADGCKQYVDCLAGMAQITFKDGRFQTMAKTYLGQNMSHLGFCTGYGRVEGSDDAWSPLLASTSWLYADYGGVLKVGAFAGYMKNLGADSKLSEVYAWGGDIDRMMRLAPSIKYKPGNTQFCMEYELTGVSYGERESHGTVKGGDCVFNHRLLLAVTYLFNL